MRWLADQFGLDRLLEATVILPTEEYFPEPYTGDEQSVRLFLDRLCAYMGVPPRQVSLEIRPDNEMPGAAGLYQRRRRSVITVARSQLADPNLLRATLAHELAHELLLGGGLLTAEVPDHEWVTDLLPVFLGTGVFLANATVQDSSGDAGGWSWWSISRQGYLPSRMFGYAFALFAFLRDEQDPPWAGHLRLDASSALRAGLRFLRKTGDSLFHPETARQRLQPPTAGEVVHRLRTGTPTIRLATLWEIWEQQLTDPVILPAVQACLADRDPAIPGVSARTLGIFGAAAEGATPLLLEALWHGADATKVAAAEALGAIGSNPERVVPELSTRLRGEDREMIDAAARALTRFGPRAESAVPALLAALEPALVECDHPLIECLLGALQAISGDARGQVHDYFRGRDPQLRRLALDVIREMG